VKIIIQILFFIGLFLLIVSYFISPYIINEGQDIVIDEDTVGFLKMLYVITTFIFGYLLFAFLRIFKNKSYLIFSFIFLVVSLIFLAKMFLYFDSFLE